MRGSESWKGWNTKRAWQTQIRCPRRFCPRSRLLPSLLLPWHLTRGPSKRKLIFQVPSHSCHSNVGARICLQAKKKLTSKLGREKRATSGNGSWEYRKPGHSLQAPRVCRKGQLEPKAGGSLARTGASTCSAMLLANQQIIFGSSSPAFCHQPAEMKQSQKAGRVGIKQKPTSKQRKPANN